MCLLAFYFVVYSAKISHYRKLKVLQKYMLLFLMDGQFNEVEIYQ